MKRLNDLLIFLMLFVPPLFFFTDLTRNPYYFQIVLLNSLAVLIFALWLYGGIKTRELRVATTVLDLQLWLFVLVATASWLYMLSRNIHEPYLSYGVFNEGFKRWLFLLTNCVLAYYIAVQNVNDDTRDRYVRIFIWVGILASAYFNISVWNLFGQKS